MHGQVATANKTISSFMEPVDTGNIATPKYSTAFNMGDYPGRKFVAVVRAAVSITGAAANGVTFSLEDSVDGSTGWTAKDASTVEKVLPKLTAIGVQSLSFWPREGGPAPRPYVRVKALSDNNATLYSVSAVVLVEGYPSGRW